jgi:integrase
MPRPKNPAPAYKHHKPTNTARCWVNGAWVSLGKFNSPESLQAHARICAEMASAPALSLVHTPATANSILSVNELLLAYLKWIEKNRPTSEGKSYRGGTHPRFALRTVRDLYGHIPISEFGPRALKALRETWVTVGLSRKVINGRVGAVRRMFRWAVGEEIVGPELYQRLQAVEGLRAGQTKAHDWAPVMPALMADVEKALLHMPSVVQAILQVQLHSAARAGELVKLRVCDLDKTNPDAWVYQPNTHKGTWKGKIRVIYFGKKAQEILAPFLLKAGNPEAFVFSPARSEAERNAERSENRVTQKWESHMERNEQKRIGKGRKRPPGERYTTATYRRAIERACERVGVPVFTPHRLRHLAATRVRAELGVDVARALCGHTLAAVTEIYSREVDKQLALKAVEKFG